MARDSRAVMFATVMRAIRSVKDTWSKEAEKTETEAIAMLTAPDLLILDEVGVQFGSETEKLILFDVLNERYEKRLPTLLLSNLDLGGVRTYLGERVFDRLREDGGEVVIFDWQSHRGRV
jgi:DNA replication protein DnaC